MGSKHGRRDIQAALELSWVKWDAKRVKEVEEGLKNDPNAPKNPSQLVLDVEIIEVLTYHDDFAVVVCKESQVGEGSYCGGLFGRINGMWKGLGPLPPGSSPSVQAAVESFDKKKDDLWRQFVEIRNDVLNGRTPTYDAKGRVVSADSMKSAKIAQSKTAASPAENGNRRTNDKIPVPSCDRIDYSRPVRGLARSMGLLTGNSFSCSNNSVAQTAGSEWNHSEWRRP